MKNIVIIGAGQIGSRHLQALALYKNALSIYLVDPSIAALRISESRFKEVDTLGNKQLYLVKYIADIPPNIEFAIISTNSIQRLSVLEELLNHCIVKYLLLEKFLFPNENEYIQALNLIENTNTKAYVNCSRRMWTSYSKLKEEFKCDSNVKLFVYGSNWNMASNAIHFLDLFFYLCDEDNIIIDVGAVDNTILENKRDGYIDFTGTIKGTTEKEQGICFVATLGEKEPLRITIESNNRSYLIIESKGVIRKQNEEEEPFNRYFQSELTHKIYEQLEKTGSCDVTPFKDSIKYHLILLKAFNKFLNGREGLIT